MKSQASVRQQSRPVVRILKVTLVTVAILLALSGSILAQRQLPFIGTRTFCSEDDEGQATITIRKDGFTTVKSDMIAEDEVGPFAFSGMLSAKGIVRRESGRYLEIISATAIRMHDGGVKINGKPCSEIFARESIVYAVAFSPDGKTLASGNRSSTIKLWDAASGQELKTLIGHSHAVTSLAFSPDGLRLASVSQDQTIKLWDVASGRELKTFKGNLYSVAFSPDGSTLAGGGQFFVPTRNVPQDVSSTIKLWNVSSGQELNAFKPGKGESDIVFSVAFSPDGRMLASGGNDNYPRHDTISLWDVASGRRLRILTGHNGPISSVAFTPDGKTLASGGVDIKLWNVASGQAMKTLKGHSSVVTSVAFSPDRGTLASGGDENGTIKLWDVASGQELKSLRGHLSVVRSVALSPDGQTLVSGSDDKTVKVWDMASGEELKTLRVLPKESNDVRPIPAASSLATQVKLTQEDVTRLRAYVDPNTGESCDFPDDPKILPQLRLLLGEDLPHLEDNLGRGSGCWIKNGWLGFDGFRPHKGGQEHGFVSINLDSGATVAGIFTWTTDRRLMTWSNPKFKIYGITGAYSGDLNTLPGPLADWIRETWAGGIEATRLGGMEKIDANAPPNIELQRFQPLKTAVANPTSSASSQTYIEVSLEEVTDLAGLGKSFPFLKSELDEVIADNKKPASGFGLTNVYVFDLNQKGLPRLIFVAMDGGLVCGSAGCSLTIYRAQGKGFGRVLDALVDVQSPIYISTDRSSLLTCGSGGRGDWRFRNNEFEPVPGKPRPSQKLAPCGTHAISDAGNANTTVTATPLPVERPTSEKPTSEVAKETDPAALELSYWESIRNSRNPDDFKAYLEKYPNGQFAELARLRVQQFSRPVSNTPSNDTVAAERARNKRVFEVRDAAKKSGWLTVASDSISFEPKKSKEAKSILIQCSEIRHIEQGQSTVASPHINLFLNGTERAVVFYTSSGGTGLVGIFVNSKPVRPVVDITAKVINAISEACKLNPNNP